MSNLSKISLDEVSQNEVEGLTMILTNFILEASAT